MLADRVGSFLDRRTSRRGFLSRTALIGSALVAAPRTFVLQPVSAYAALCGIDTTFSAGYTVMCCTVNRGMNACPPGTFVGGWWKADNTAYCCNDGQRAPRYYIDCQATCTKCRKGCADSYCDRECWNCSCRSGPSYTCDQRRDCCNIFRYGQCHQEIGCGGPVACRVVTCTPPYLLYDDCGTATLYDQRTAQHTAPCLAGPCT